MKDKRFMTLRRTLDIPVTLSYRELEVLWLSLEEWRDCKSIAHELNISTETVKRHRKNIARKLGLEGRNAFRILGRKMEFFLGS